MSMIFFILIICFVNVDSEICKYEDSVELRNKSYNGIKYNFNEYIFDNKTGGERGCICLKEVCVRKCCSLGEMYDKTRESRCYSSPEVFNPPVWNGTELQALNTSKLHIITSGFYCEEDKNEVKVFLNTLSKTYRLKTDGKLYVSFKSSNPPEIIYGPDKFCLENFFVDSTVILDGHVCMVAVVEANHWAISAITMLISCFFIILTVIVYLILPELRTTMHGKMMIACLSSFFLWFLFMGTELITLLWGYLDRNNCTILAFFIYFFMLAGFFWMNVMSYDVCIKFRKVNDISNSRHRFLKYSLYAYGVPAALTILLAGLEFSGLEKEDTLLPDINHGTCFLSGHTRMIYLYVPILLLCIVNIIFYTLAVMTLVKAKKQTQILRKKDTQQMWLYIKLFALTGFTWILEVISFLVPALERFWIVTDVFNVLVGLIIFILYVCKKKTLADLQKRYSFVQKVMSLKRYIKSQPDKTAQPSSTPQPSATPCTVEEIHMHTVNDIDK